MIDSDGRGRGRLANKRHHRRRLRSPRLLVPPPALATTMITILVAVVVVVLANGFQFQQHQHQPQPYYRRRYDGGGRGRQPRHRQQQYPTELRVSMSSSSSFPSGEPNATAVAYLASISDAVSWDDEGFPSAEEDEDPDQERVDAAKRRRMELYRRDRRRDANADNNNAASFDAEQADDVKRYELTLQRPIGLLLKETEDGYVTVSGFTDKAPNLVKWAVEVGDRVVAVDSNLGSRMWPVSTVEGVVSACTSRLPGQSIRMSFERTTTTVVNNNDRSGGAGGSNNAALLQAVVASAPAAATADTASEGTAADEKKKKKISAASAVGSNSNSNSNINDNRQLLSRCRDVLRRYAIGADESTVLSQQKLRQGRFALSLGSIVADKVLDALGSAHAVVDATTLSMVMTAYLKCDKPLQALRAFEAAAGFAADGSTADPSSSTTTIAPSESALNLYTGTCLLQAHAALRDLDSVKRVLAALEGRSGIVVGDREVAPWPWTGPYGTVRPDARLYNIAVGAAEKVGTPEALEFAFEIFDDRFSDPTAPSSSSSSSLSAATTASRQRNKPARDVVTYNSLISALTNAGESDRAFALFDEMKRSGIRPDKYTYTSLIKACRDEGDVQEVLYDMRECGVDADTVTFNTMIKSLCESRKWTQATRLVTEMESRGIAPDSMTYGYLMNAMLKADKPNACLALFESACANARTASLTENVYLYTTAITAAAVLEDHDRALELVSRMKANGIGPNLKTLTALVGACLSSGKGDLAAQLFQRIDEPDGYAVAQGIRAHCADGDVAKAFELLSEQVRGKDALMSGKDVMRSYAVVVRAALDHKDYDVAKRTFADLCRKGYIPGKAVFAAITDAMAAATADTLRVGKYSIAKSEVDNTGDVNDNDDSKERLYAFSLFVVDSLRKRNLSLDGRFYSAVLYLGNRLGGARRKIASLLASRSASSAANVKEILSTTTSIPAAAASQSQDTDIDAAAPTQTDAVSFKSWEDLLVRCAGPSGEKILDEHMRSSSSLQPLLPSVPVRVATRDVRRVLKAEQLVTSYALSSKTKRRGNNKNKSIKSDSTSLAGSSPPRSFSRSEVTTRNPAAALR